MDENINVEETASGQETEAGRDSGTEKRPQRYKIYDRIADNVSLNTINIIIIVVSVLLVGFVIYGIATGHPNA